MECLLNNGDGNTAVVKKPQVPASGRKRDKNINSRA